MNEPYTSKKGEIKVLVTVCVVQTTLTVAADNEGRDTDYILLK